MEIDYEKDLAIDVDALDVESADQPTRFMRYSKLLADANRDYDKAKERLSVVEAQLDTKYRKEAKEAGDKVTEAVIASRVKLDTDYQTGYETLLNIKYEADILRAAVFSFQQRKDSIENLIRLAQMGYFATPSVPRDLSQEMKARIAQRTSENVSAGVSETKERIRKLRC